MNKALLKFLQDHEDQDDVWFIVSGAVIYGKLNTIEGARGTDPQMITLSESFYYSGDKKRELDIATILVDQIGGWGEPLNDTT
jgi:hypothetical protein